MVTKCTLLKEAYTYAIIPETPKAPPPGKGRNAPSFLCPERALTAPVLLEHLPNSAQTVFFLLQRLPDSSRHKSKLSHSRVWSHKLQRVKASQFGPAIGFTASVPAPEWFLSPSFPYIRLRTHRFAKGQKSSLGVGSAREGRVVWLDWQPRRRRIF